MHDVQSDGDCLFSVLAHQLGRDLSAVSQIRSELVAYMLSPSNEIRLVSMIFIQATIQYYSEIKLKLISAHLDRKPWALSVAAMP